MCLNCVIVLRIYYDEAMVFESPKVDVTIFDLPYSVEQKAVADDVRVALRRALPVPPAVLVCQVAWAAVHQHISFDHEEDVRVRMRLLDEMGEGFAITKVERKYLMSHVFLPAYGDHDWIEMQLLAAALFTAAERRKYLREIFSLEAIPPLLLPRRLGRVGTIRLGNSLRVDVDFARAFGQAYRHDAGPIVLPGFMPDEYTTHRLEEELGPMRFASAGRTFKFFAGSALRVGLLSTALLRDSGASPSLHRSSASHATVKTSDEILELMPSLARFSRL